MPLENIRQGYPALRLTKEGQGYPAQRRAFGFTEKSTDKSEKRKSKAPNKIDHTHHRDGKN
ncbi:MULTISPECIES: hypothetical protein [unclassified Rhodanobacter]|uniref:hypothetical protein n=1 Tax=unclassified Rhodanobacter TaxID=2621553 RepID=UPI00128FE126|nr:MULTISPECIES: hypothetical protein [unclassified Rhodanobacter]